MGKVSEQLKGLDYSVKSRTIRDEAEEITVQLDCDEGSLGFMDKLRALPEVLDSTLVQYNGEYHG